jgi:WhiB family redox-sensing transcriptional regulator
MEWLDEAMCLGLHADFFFPPLDTKVPNQYYAVGKYVCKGCPVWRQCKSYCDSNDEVWGLWAGLTPQERKRPHLLSHGSLESYRSGCRCSSCLSADSVTGPPDLRKVPKSHQEFDLTEVVYSITTQGTT